MFIIFVYAKLHFLDLIFLGQFPNLYITANLLLAQD